MHKSLQRVELRVYGRYLSVPPEDPVRGLSAAAQAEKSAARLRAMKTRVTSLEQAVLDEAELSR